MIPRVPPYGRRGHGFASGSRSRLMPATRWPESAMRRTFRGGRKTDGQDPFCEADRGPDDARRPCAPTGRGRRERRATPPTWTIPDINSLPDSDHGRLVRRGRDLITAPRRAVCEPVSANSRTGLRPAEMGIEKWRAETGVRNPPRTDRNTGNWARQPNPRECRGFSHTGK
jgi:hypothetical protein